MVKAKCLRNGQDCDRSVLQEDDYLGSRRGRDLRDCIPRDRVILRRYWCFQETLGDVLELSRGRLYPLFSGNNDVSLCKGSK